MVRNPKDILELRQGKMWFHAPLCSLPVWPHIGRQSLSPIFPLYYQFYSIPSSQQLEQQASNLRGQQQLFMGVLFMHWATIWVRNQLPCRLPSLRVFRVQRITPDFIVEYFIEPYQQYMQTTLQGGLEPAVMVTVKLKDKTLQSVQ